MILDDSSEYNHNDPCESIHCEVGYVCVRNQEGSEGKCVRLGLVGILISETCCI